MRVFTALGKLHEYTPALRVSQLFFLRKRPECYDPNRVEYPACPGCGTTTYVNLLASLEQGDRFAQEWVCRACLTNFGNVPTPRSVTPTVLATIGLVVGTVIVFITARGFGRRARHKPAPDFSPALAP